MFALHPVTLAYPSPSTRPPSLFQLTFQVAGFFVIQILFTHYILRFIAISPAGQGEPLTKAVEPHPDDEILTAIVMDFLRPRGTLLLGITAMGLPSRFTDLLGRLHPLAMVVWVVLDCAHAMMNGRVCWLKAGKNDGP
jgi:hypothetical protein